MAEHSEVIRALVEGFVRFARRRGNGEPTAQVGRRARWLVRVMVSLLVFPGGDEADERTMLAEFVAPLVIPGQLPVE